MKDTVPDSSDTFIESFSSVSSEGPPPQRYDQSFFTPCTRVPQSLSPRTEHEYPVSLTRQCHPNRYSPISNLPSPVTSGHPPNCVRRRHSVTSKTSSRHGTTTNMNPTVAPPRSTLPSISFTTTSLVDLHRDLFVRGRTVQCPNTYLVSTKDSESSGVDVLLLF